MVFSSLAETVPSRTSCTTPAVSRPFRTKHSSAPCYSNFSSGISRPAGGIFLTNPEPQTRHAPIVLFLILYHQRASMRFSDLPRKNQTYPSPSWFRGEEWDKQICRIRNPRPIVFNLDFRVAIGGAPTNSHHSCAGVAVVTRALAFQNSIHRVS